VSKIGVRQPQAMFNGEETYDNRTEEIHRSRRTTYREGKHSVAGTSNLSCRRLEVSVTRAAVRIGGRDRAGRLGTGCIQSVSESGMRIGTHMSTAEQLTGISMQ